MIDNRQLIIVNYRLRVSMTYSSGTAQDSHLDSLLIRTWSGCRTDGVGVRGELVLGMGYLIRRFGGCRLAAIDPLVLPCHGAHRQPFRAIAP